MEHSAILLTFIKLPFVINTSVLSFLSGRFTQVLLYFYTYILNNNMDLNKIERVIKTFKGTITIKNEYSCDTNN